MTLRRRPDGRKSDRSQRQSAAQELAITALTFIAADPERLGRFLVMTGIGPESIRDAAREPHFLAGVLDHIGADERLLVAFAAENEIDPSAVIRARELLAGGQSERDVP
jgi:hypothetical protein